MNYLRNSRKHNYLPSLKILPQTKHPNSSFSTATVENPDTHQSENVIPANFPNHPPQRSHLVYPSNVTKKIPISQLCSKSSHLDQHQFSGTISSNKLITNYIRSGDLDSAVRAFERMVIKTTVSWNSILAGLAKKPGKMKEAQDLFVRIPEPDTVSYNIMLVCHLYNCGIASAMEFFHKMPVKDTASWNTMISGFAQDGKMQRAKELFSSMPEKNSVSWSAMISGYVQCGDLDSAVELFEIAPVKIHEFRSGDRMHPELATIHEKLIELDKKMKLAGYVPNLEFALHDVGQEQKEQLLLWHSEKLAIALGLIKMPAGIPIRVFKNLRICGDCHRAAKYISAIERREIIVRDTTRFHHFKNGICSCGGYW
ncbi:hypothetical protein FEM48_Zijuj11G0067800 [Ziziphus jujuba var. spinosa]|uniref:DYW domain-containing protein n=1 Tax=Ziziphus jujuba var. spinosa TaxID=714518 RepID=A0A978UHF9_ZIZJJ|nr:hypothetical protein FEM48_Zijuj11G0067800 [Ziziphus jujuba var. spinosa]